MPMPYRCRFCGHEFADNAVAVIGSGNLSVSNIRVSCPKCGQMAPAFDGQYHYEKSQLVDVTGSVFAKEAAGRLGLLVQRAKNKEITAKEVLAELGSISPELADKIHEKGGMSLLAVIILLVWLLSSVELNITVDVNELLDQAAQYGENEELYGQPEPPIPNEAIVKPVPKFTIAAVDSARPLNRGERRKQAAIDKRTNKGRA